LTIGVNFALISLVLHTLIRDEREVIRMDGRAPDECKHGIRTAMCAYCSGKTTTAERVEKEEEQPSKGDVYERIVERKEKGRDDVYGAPLIPEAEVRRPKIQKPEVRTVILPLLPSPPPLPVPPALPKILSVPVVPVVEKKDVSPSPMQRTRVPTPKKTKAPLLKQIERSAPSLPPRMTAKFPTERKKNRSTPTRITRGEKPVIPRGWKSRLPQLPERLPLLKTKFLFREVVQGGRVFVIRERRKS
jgi:hypothetical protein